VASAIAASSQHSRNIIKKGSCNGSLKKDSFNLGNKWKLLNRLEFGLQERSRIKGVGDSIDQGLKKWFPSL
jgi:hypothetical protein